MTAITPDALRRVVRVRRRFGAKEAAMANVLIAYGTTEGHTAKVAHHIAQAGRRAGHHVDVRLAGPDLEDVARYDAILVAASVHEGRHQAAVRSWIVAHREALDRKPSAFVQVCLTSARRDPEHDRQAAEVVEAMSAHTGWVPRRVGYVAGALLYTQYSWLKRMALKWIASREGGDTDTTRDFEYTDWDALTRWSDETFAAWAGHTSSAHP